MADSAESQTFLSTNKVNTSIDASNGVKMLKHEAANGQSKKSEAAAVDSEHIELVAVSQLDSVRDVGSSNEVLDLGCTCSRPSTRYGYVVMAIMLLSNMLNYMDRFTIAGRLEWLANGCAGNVCRTKMYHHCNAFVLICLVRLC